MQGLYGFFIIFQQISSHNLQKQCAMGLVFKYLFILLQLWRDTSRPYMSLLRIFARVGPKGFQVVLGGRYSILCVVLVLVLFGLLFPLALHVVARLPKQEVQSPQKRWDLANITPCRRRKSSGRTTRANRRSSQWPTHVTLPAARRHRISFPPPVRRLPTPLSALRRPR